MKLREMAKISGWSLLLMAVLGGVVFGYAYPGALEAVESQVVGLENYLRLMLAGLATIIILDLIVSYNLYRYFEQDNPQLSLWAALVRVVYAIVFVWASYFVWLNFQYEAADPGVLISNFQAFDQIWGAGLIVFGVHLLLIGVLMKAHRFIPKALWYLTLVAGASYIVVHFMKLYRLPLADTLELVLGLPMALGELGLAVWLLWKGGKP